MSRRATLREVAAAAGVDLSTASRVLRNDPAVTVRPETRERILRAARALNYWPNLAARALRLRKTLTLALFIPDITNPVFHAVIRGAEQAARAEGYSLLLCHIDERALAERLYLRLVWERRVDGLLLATAQTRDILIAEVSQSGVPFVLINRRAEGVPRYVIADDTVGAQMAVSYLIELGHRSIAHLAGPLTTDTALRRLQGYRQALEQHGLPFASALVEECGFSRPSGTAGMHRLLSRARPTAVFATNLLVAVGAMIALREVGLRVPEDVSVVGFHNAELAELVSPPLTTVEFPLYQMGYEAAKSLLALIRGERDTVHLVLPPTGLVVRQSAAAPPG